MPSEHTANTYEETAGEAVESDVLALKTLVVGGFGVEKTTLVGVVSEIRPLRTEEFLSEAGQSVDDTDGVVRKTTTTVAMDFGRHHQVRALAPSVRHTGTGPLLVPVGRTLPGRARRRRPRRHPSAGGPLPGRRLLRTPPRPLRRRSQLLRRRSHIRRTRGVPRARSRPRHPSRPVRCARPGLRQGVLTRMVEYAGRMHTARLLDPVS